MLMPWCPSSWSVGKKSTAYSNTLHTSLPFAQGRGSVKRAAVLASPKGPWHLKNPCWTKKSSGIPPSLLAFGPSGTRPLTNFFLCARVCHRSCRRRPTAHPEHPQQKRGHSWRAPKTPHRAWPPLWPGLGSNSRSPWHSCGPGRMHMVAQCI